MVDCSLIVKYSDILVLSYSFFHCVSVCVHPNPLSHIRCFSFTGQGRFSLSCRRVSTTTNSSQSSHHCRKLRTSPLSHYFPSFRTVSYRGGPWTSSKTDWFEILRSFLSVSTSRVTPRNLSKYSLL